MCLSQQVRHFTDGKKDAVSVRKITYFVGHEGLISCPILFNNNPVQCYKIRATDRVVK